MPCSLEMYPDASFVCACEVNVMIGELLCCCVVARRQAAAKESSRCTRGGHETGSRNQGKTNWLGFEKTVVCLSAKAVWHVLDGLSVDLVAKRLALVAWLGGWGWFFVDPSPAVSSLCFASFFLADCYVIAFVPSSTPHTVNRSVSSFTYSSWPQHVLRTSTQL